VGIERDQSELTTTLHLNQPNSFSSKSNQALENLNLEEKEIIAQISESAAMFIILHGPEKGARFLIDQDEMRIGRESSSDIFLDDATVSRKHAKLSREKIGSAVQFKIHDEESLNGTYVNGISQKELVLQDGDELNIGKFRLTFFSKKILKAGE
jgi:pSer/pThr/pTyr-binding forkhead associated (FHA) protein